MTVSRPRAALSHLFVLVRSLPEAHAFYVGALGLEVLAGGPDAGYMRIGGGDGFTIGMEEGAAADVGATGIEIVVAVDDVDRRYAELSGTGIAFEAAPADQEWGMRHAWLRDPSGYRISLSSPNIDTT